jgi:hypothetical protein
MSTAAKMEALGPRVVVGRLTKARPGARRQSAEKESRVAGGPQPARVAVLLGLAHSVQRAIDAGEIRDQAEAARRHGISRPRMTQILDLTLLSARVQESVLGAVVGVKRVTERALREVLENDSWALQEAVWTSRE